MQDLIKATLTAATLPSLKRYLKVRWPGVKASHRLEAYARACGFRTYASLRARIADHNSVAVDYIPDQLERQMRYFMEKDQDHA